ncbi:MAG: hypothetical protein HY291_00840 [Planctomycetes bacterium]|nr:hypothetical protein [Planctomycetota bacterium]
MRSVRFIPIASAFAILTLLAAGRNLRAAETVRVDPAKVEQLRRLEPLTPDKVKIFVDSGQLTERQSELVVKYIDKNGTLALPDWLIGREAPPAAPAGPAAPAAVRHSDGSLDTVAWIREDDARNPLAALPADQEARLEDRLRQFRGSNGGLRESIKEDVRALIPASNFAVYQMLKDPVDLEDAVSMWKAVAFPGNPRAAGFIARMHQDMMRTANPILIPYAKDIGGLILRRKSGNEQPARRWYDSRDIRNDIIELEQCIAQCSGVRASTYLADLFSARYASEEAPMRDSSRDQKRIVEACGANKEAFDRGKPSSWHSALSGFERALIAERLVQMLASDKGDLRDIARDGLLVCLGSDTNDKDLKKRLDKAHDNWGNFLSWYAQRRAELASGR